MQDFLLSNVQKFRLSSAEDNSDVQGNLIFDVITDAAQEVGVGVAVLWEREVSALDEFVRPSSAKRGAKANSSRRKERGRGVCLDGRHV